MGLTPSLFDKYPNELSGGQCQRTAITRAVISNPDFVACDEAVSALDASVRSSVLHLLKDLQAQKGISCLFISHDLSVINYMSDRVIVMSLGTIVESAVTRNLFAHPTYPYTKEPLSAIPIPQYGVQKEYVALEGEVPSPPNPPSECRFHTRCTYAGKEYKECCLALHPIGNDHYVACHRVISN